MKNIKDIVLAGDKRPAVLEDCSRLIDEEVASKGGLSGVGIKLAYKTVKALKPTMIRDSVDFLLDDFLDRLQPFYETFQNQKLAGGIEQFVVSNASPIAEALLGITDARAAKSKNNIVKGAYGKLRPEGKKQVEAAMPRIGRMLAKHGA